MAIVGTPSDDILNGTNLDDLIQGLEGADYIQAFEGNDSVLAGPGNDIVYAAGGNDKVYADTGNDQVFAGLGDDLVYGGDGNDLIDGEAGNDVLLGEAGNDRIIGGFGSDFLSGGDGNDLIESHSTNVSNYVIERDEIFTGAGKDIVRLRTDYLGGAASLNPRSDASFALIRDFDPTQDTLDMRYDQNYTIRYGNFYGTKALDTILSYKGNTVAVVQDNQLSSSALT